MRRVTKNPFMSLWLSAANRVAGTGMGLWAAAAKRQQAAMTRQAISDFWKSGTKKRRKKS